MIAMLFFVVFSLGLFEILLGDFRKALATKQTRVEVGVIFINMLTFRLRQRLCISYQTGLRITGLT